MDIKLNKNGLTLVFYKMINSIITRKGKNES